MTGGVEGPRTEPVWRYVTQVQGHSFQGSPGEGNVTRAGSTFTVGCGKTGCETTHCTDGGTDTTSPTGSSLYVNPRRGGESARPVPVSLPESRPTHPRDVRNKTRDSTGPSDRGRVEYLGVSPVPNPHSLSTGT